MRVARYAANNHDYNYATDETKGLMDGKISIDLDLTEKKLKRKFLQSGESHNS